MRLHQGIGALGGLCCLLFPNAASGQVAVNVLQENEPIPGGDETQIITSIGGPQVNGVGGFVFGLNTTDGVGPSLSHFFGDAFGGSGGLWRTEGTIAGYQQNAFEGYYGLSDAGGIAYSPSTDAIGGASGLDSVWLNDTPIAVEEDAIPDSANFVSFGSRPTVSYNGGLWWIGGETDTQGGSTDVRGLYAGSVDNPIVRQGDAVAGFASPVDGIDFDFAISGNGSNWIDLLMFNTGSSGDDGGVVLNGAALMAGGSVVQESDRKSVV